MDTKFFITQLIGLIAYTFLSFSYFKKDKKNILLIQIFSYTTFVIHYYLLGAITGSVCNVLGLFAFILIYLFDKYKKNKKILICILIPILIGISIITFENIYSIFPIIASVIAISSFLTDDENIIRLLGIVSNTCWLIYAIFYKSYFALPFEIVTLVSVMIAYIKGKKK